MICNVLQSRHVILNETTNLQICLLLNRTDNSRDFMKRSELTLSRERKAIFSQWFCNSLEMDISMSRPT